ncbi:MAG: ribosomal protein S18-alanine N-acetyltransferase [Lachnospiraceae bacterium]|nr:ribosomal protein S18-alanine N-acetyltransferase [Lachnospiraceae bacterium]
MITINFAKKEQIKLISEFEINEFNSEAYSFDMLNDMMKDNYLLKDNDNIFVLLDDEDLIGYIIFHISKDFTDIFKIFIRDNDKRKGYATMLLNKVIDLAKRYNSHKLMVEVRAKNLNAINFYKKNNFEQISIRDKYYKNPTDDALIFERSL